MHPKLERQLKKLGIDKATPPDAEVWEQFLERISQTYSEADQDRRLLERSLTVSSREMHDLYDSLRLSSEARTATLTEANERLQREIGERKRAEEALQEQRAFLRQVIDINPHFIFAKDRNGRFTLANEAFAKAYGTTVDELIGKTEADFNPNKDLVERYNRDDLAVMDSYQELFIPEDKIINVKGQVRWRQTIKRPIVDEHGVAQQVLGVATDITERKRAEVQRDHFTNQLRTAADISKHLNAILDPDRLLGEVVTLLKTRFDLYHVHIYLLHETRQELIMLAGSGEVGGRLRQRGHKITLNYEHSLVAKAARSQEIILANDVRVDPNFLPNPLLPDTRAEVAVPLIAGGTVLGVFDVQDNRVNRFSHSELDTFSTLSGQIAIALENARLFAEHKQAEEALIVARDQALEASRLKSELLAKVSHELRTPLGAILGYIELLEDGTFGPLSEQQIEVISEVIDSTNYLTDLVNELLDQAQLESGRIKLSISPFAPVKMVEQVQSKMNILAQAKGIRLTTDIADDIPPVLSGDQNRLLQILVNLVSNAIKFTKVGVVNLRLFCPDSTHWAMQVSDTGPGIPAEVHRYVFEPFWQVDGSPTRAYVGTGLGLSIVSQLTTLMGGRITLASNLGQGSTFTVVLPLTPIQEQIV